MNNIIKYIINNSESFFTSIIASILAAIPLQMLKMAKKTPQNINDVLNSMDFNSKHWGEEMDNALMIKETIKVNFPEYKDYLLIQYGSSVQSDSRLASDYDFIVLLLGYPEKETRYMHNKGTISDISSSENKDHVDIVFRDYLSFLFAASAGMPYENSVIMEGRLVKGHEGYFQWLKNITKNNLFDRDFLIRRFEEKIAVEKQEFQKCINEYEKFDKDIYYVIRSGYYFITSLLQLNRIKNFDKIVIQKDVIELSKVRNFYNDFEDRSIREKYEKLVENLKRNKEFEKIELKEIMEILKSLDKSKEV